MPVSKALKRLLRVRGLEEEQHRSELELAMAELRRIEAALQECAARELRGRELVCAPDSMAERQAGHVELITAQRRAGLLEERKLDAEREAMRLREVFLEKRIERRQAETLVDEAQTQEQLRMGHRAQQSLDEWHAGKASPGNGAARPLGPKDEGIVSEDAVSLPDTGIESHF